MNRSGFPPLPFFAAPGALAAYTVGVSPGPHPADERDLADDRKRRGFVNLNSDFERRGARFEGTCSRVVTGHLAGDNRLREVGFPIGDVETGRAPVSPPVHPGIEGRQ